MTAFCRDFVAAAFRRPLTEEQKRQVLDLVEQLTHQSVRPSFDLYGTCADLRVNLSFEEFQRNRREMWGNASDQEF